MRMTDHSYGWPKPESSDQVLYHNRCGSKINKNYVGDYYCGPCSQQWRGDTLNRFTQEELGVRFHIRPISEDVEGVLVWKSEEGKAFLSIVKPEEADKYKRDPFICGGN